MNPEPITQTSAGMETPTQTVERVKRVMKPISAETIGTTPAFVPPPAPTKDASLSRLESRFEPTVPAAETPAQEQPNLRQSLVERQLAALEKLGTRGTRTQEVMDEQQVLAKQKALDATDKDIATRERYYENRRRALEDQGGGLKVGLESEQNTLRRERARELADLYIIRAGQQQDVETARQYANDLIDAEFEPLKEELEYSGKIYQMLANDLTDSEKIQVQQQLTEKNNNTEFVRNTASQVYNELINSGAYTPERGRLLKEAMAEASTAIQNGQSPEGAIAKMRGTLAGVTTLGQLQMQAQRANIAQTYASIDLAERKFAYQQQQDAVNQELETLKASGQITEEQAQNQQKVEQALQLKDLIDQIRGHAGFNLSVGSVGQKLFSPKEGMGLGQVYNYLSGKGEGFDALYDQLTENLTLANLDKMTGVLTDRDIQVLRSAATRLRKTTSEQEFLGVLDEMERTFQRSVDEYGITPQQARFYYGVDNNTLNEIDELWGETNGSTIDFTY